MCLIFIAYEQDPLLPWVVLANRDEFLARPAEGAHWWPGAQVFAGKDLQAGGTWLGVSRSGRFAALTNVREPHNIKADAPSRGQLVTDFLEGTMSAETYLTTVAEQGQAYNGFNLIVYDQESAWSYGNRTDAPVKLAPGVYGVSNAVLDTPWPKLVTGKKALTEWLALDADNREDDAAFRIMQDPHIYPDDQLPDTGVPYDWERSLSARFIRRNAYGTRCTSLVQYHQDGHITMEERSYVPVPVRVREAWNIQEAS